MEEYMIQYTMMTSIEEDNLRHLNRFKIVPPHPSYIAGFIDGDGCIFIRKIKDGYQSGITIAQCRTNILQVIRYHFGGSITSSANRNNKTINLLDDETEHYHKHNIRNQYNLIIRSNNYNVLLKYLENCFVTKESQYQCLYKFNKLANLPNKNEEKDIIYSECLKSKKQTFDILNLTKINIEYIAGLFDAEGCFYINHKKLHKFYISITQKNHPELLSEMVKFLGFGKHVENKFIIYNKQDSLKFICLIKEYLIVKYNQAFAFEKYLTTDDKNIKLNMYQICNEEKHKIETFINLNNNDDGKDSYFETIRLQNIKMSICKEIETMFVYKKKSDKMKCEGNHNCGKTFSTETKKKMSDSIRDAKGGVSDEIIIKVRELLKEGHKNIDVQNLLNLPRHTVTRIKNGHIICRNEVAKNNKSLTQEQVNLSKRKITADEIIIVIEKFIEQLKPIQILDYFIEQNKNNITIDMIKNIKRNLKNGKSVIYECELIKERYDYYLNLLQQFLEINT